MTALIASSQAKTPRLRHLRPVFHLLNLISKTGVMDSEATTSASRPGGFRTPLTWAALAMMTTNDA